MSGAHDYVIVGAGTAGCVLAARLAQSGASVLLLEAGGPAPAGELTRAASWPDLVGSDADWGDVTVPQADAGPQRYPLGRGLGGSGSLNAMAHVRGHRAVYDAWAAAGAAGWDYLSLLPYFRRSECRKDGDPRERGDAGPVTVAPVPGQLQHPVAVALASALTAAGYPVTGDLSAGRQEGIAWADLAIGDRGERVSPLTAYLRPAMDVHPGLDVRTGCLATRLEIHRDRCTGVSYIHDGRPAVARAAGEVIVCAGAIGSPRLLMLSGIGPARHLRELGITAVADLPGVGQNLQDHPTALASYRTAAPLPRSKYNHGEVYAALRSPLADGYPDLHVFPILIPAATPGRQPAPGFSLAASVMTPASRGTVRLPSADPGARPRIDPALLASPRDLERLAAGLAIARHAAASPAFASMGVAETAPGTDVHGPGEVRAWLRQAVGSYYHPVGTCRMGTDPDAVTDPQLRVRGITGLRVADASVMPVIPNAHPHATVLAIAERAASLIAPRP